MKDDSTTHLANDEHSAEASIVLDLKASIQAQLREMEGTISSLPDDDARRQAILELKRFEASLVAHLGADQSGVTRERAGEAELLGGALAEERHLLRALIDNLPDYIFVKDRESRFVINNKAHIRVLGAASQDEVIGKTDFDIFPQELAEQYYADEQAVIQSGHPVLGREESTIDPQGRKQWLSTTKVPLRDSHGEVVGLVGMSRDITGRRQAEEDLSRFKLGIERSSDAVFLTETDGTITYANPAFEKTYGYSQEEAVGQTPRILKSGVIPQEVYQEFWETLLAKQIVAGEIVNKTKEGKLVTIEGSNNPILDEEENIIGFLSIHRDVSERKRAEAQLEQRSAQLQTAAEVSRAATSFLDPAELIQQVVNLVRKRFELYYAGLFLVDRTGEWTGEPGKWAVLRAGTGEAGRRMVEAGHKLEIGGSSMVGWCVANAQARIALDVGEEAVRFDNPWLPETHSEMALPLISRGRIVGAMTIQSTEQAAFSDEDIAVLQTMADQLAVAIENARLYEQARTRAEREQLVRAITDQVRRGTDTEAIMRITVRELGQMLGASKSIVRLGTQEQLLSKRDGEV